MRADNNLALWGNIHSERLKSEGLRDILRRRTKLVGLKDIPSAHDFRRTLALNYLRNGGDIFTLAWLLGHTDINVLNRFLAQTDQELMVCEVLT